MPSGIKFYQQANGSQFNVFTKLTLIGLLRQPCVERVLYSQFKCIDYLGLLLLRKLCTWVVCGMHQTQTLCLTASLNAIDSYHWLVEEVLWLKGVV